MKLAAHSAEHPRRSALSFAMRAAERMHVHVHVFLRDLQKERTIFQRGFHRKSQDEARRAVPDALSPTFCLDRAFADRVGVLEQITPSTLGRSHERSALDEIVLPPKKQSRTAAK